MKEGAATCSAWVKARSGAWEFKLSEARKMRKAPTRGEATLWAELRGRRLRGWKFRRQHVLAGYVLDFYCARPWLAIEVDGPVHDGQREDDERRDDALRALGVHVVRVLDDHVLTRPDEVLCAIATCCERIADQLRQKKGCRTAKV